MSNLAKLMQEFEAIMAEKKQKEGQGAMALISAAILSFSLMSLFGVTGFTWFIGLLIPLALVAHFFLWPTFCVAGIIFVIWVISL